jgi:hypothetical protein
VAIVKVASLARMSMVESPVRYFERTANSN